MELYEINSDMLLNFMDQVYYNRLKKHEDILDKIVDECYEDYLNGVSMSEIEEKMTAEVLKILEGFYET